MIAPTPNTPCQGANGAKKLNEDHDPTQCITKSKTFYASKIHPVHSSHGGHKQATKVYEPSGVNQNAAVNFQTNAVDSTGQFNAFSFQVDLEATTSDNKASTSSQPRALGAKVVGYYASLAVFDEAGHHTRARRFIFQKKASVSTLVVQGEITIESAGCSKLAADHAAGRANTTDIMCTFLFLM